MKEIKRAVCLMLCFVMVFGLLPVHAIAIDIGDSELQPGELLDQIPTVGALEETLETTATGNLPGGTMYVLDQDGVDAGATYLIASGSSGEVSVFRNNNGSKAGQNVTVSNDTITGGFTNESTSIWTFSSGWSMAKVQ